MIIRFFDIICHLILEWKHTIYIHIAGSCNQVTFIRILTGQLETNQMTTVVQISTVNSIIFLIHPACWLHTTDAFSFLCRHQIFTYTGFRCLTSSQFI